MSTRCNILMTTNGKKPIWLYHHCDGYPEGVGKWLTDYIKANTLEDWFIWPSTLATQLVKNQNGLNDDGYEVTDDKHGDIEYLYRYNVDYEYDRNKVGKAHVTLTVEDVYDGVQETLYEFKRD